MLKLLYCAILALAGCSGATATPPTVAPSGVIAPIDLDDPQVFLSALPAAEQACLAANSDPRRVLMLAGLPGAEIASAQEAAELLACLGDDTLMRVFLSGMLVDVGPLSRESSACVRAGFAGFDLRPVIMAGDVSSGSGDDLLERAAMFGSLRPFVLALSCLNDAEWVAGLRHFAMPESNGAILKCVRETLGGPAALAAALQPLDGPIPQAFMNAESQCLMLPIPEPVGSGEISLIDRDNPEAFRATFPAAEQACLSEYPDPMDVLASLALAPLPGEADSPESAAELIACLGHDTLLRVFLSGLISDIGTLSQESSDCARAGFSSIDLRSALLAGGVDGRSEPDVAALMWAGFLMPLCLNDAERQAAFPYGGSFTGGALDGWQCLMDKLGGPAGLRSTRELWPSYYIAMVECPE